MNNSKSINGMNRSNLTRLFIGSCALCLLALVTGCKSTQQKSLLEIAAETEENYYLNEEQLKIVDNGNDFSFELFKKIAENERETNVFVSTIGLFYSLNIINNGTSGHTRQEICNALNIDSTDIERMNKLCRRLTIGQAKVKEYNFFGSSSYMRTATLLQAGKQIDKDFQEILEHDYFAKIIKGDVDGAMQDQINRWCAKQTEGLLTSFPIKQQDDISANLLVANYFNGRWIQEFDKEDTKEEPFYGGISSKVDMMNNMDREEVFSYAKLNNFSLLNIPYVGGYQLYIILPNKADGLTSLLHSLNGGIIRSAINQLKTYNRVYVKIPKFEVEYSFNANKYLASLGISKMFSDAAELNRIQSEPIKIKDIIQKSKVILDEDGTRAGAITSTSFATLSEISNPTEAYFYADHPFFFIIQDPFNNYCFMGTYWGGVKSIRGMLQE